MFENIKELEFWKLTFEVAFFPNVILTEHIFPSFFLDWLSLAEYNKFLGLREHISDDWHFLSDEHLFKM